MGGCQKGGGATAPPLWNEIIDLYPPPMLESYSLLQGGSMGGGERAPVALCREPTEPEGETRGWAALNLPTRKARPGGGRHEAVGNPPQNPGASFSGGILLPRAGTRRPQNPGARSAEGFSWPAVPTARARAAERRLTKLYLSCRMGSFRVQCSVEYFAFFQEESGQKV